MHISYSEHFCLLWKYTILRSNDNTCTRDQTASRGTLQTFNYWIQWIVTLRTFILESNSKNYSRWASNPQHAVQYKATLATKSHMRWSKQLETPLKIRFGIGIIRLFLTLVIVKLTSNHNPGFATVWIFPLFQNGLIAAAYNFIEVIQHIYGVSYVALISELTMHEVNKLKLSLLSQAGSCSGKYFVIVLSLDYIA